MKKTLSSLISKQKKTSFSCSCWFYSDLYLQKWQENFQIYKFTLRNSDLRRAQWNFEQHQSAARSLFLHSWMSHVIINSFFCVVFAVSYFKNYKKCKNFYYLHKNLYSNFASFLEKKDWIFWIFLAKRVKKSFTKFKRQNYSFIFRLAKKD